MGNIKVIALDLTERLHSISSRFVRKTVQRLTGSERSIGCLVGAGQTLRIFNQMRHYPVDIIGNYGLQYAKYNLNP